jgi:hypothetical protein
MSRAGHVHARRGEVKTAWLLALLVVSGCATVTPTIAPPATQLRPLPAASLGQTRSAQQVVRAAFGSSEATMQCVVDVTPERMDVIALNAIGMRLFSVTVEGEKVTVERAPGVPEQVQPEQILRDIQLAYWPLGVLQANLLNTTWEVAEPFAGTRRLKRDGRLIAEVHYAQPGTDPWRGRLWLSNFEFGYSLAVDSTPVDGD